MRDSSHLPPEQAWETLLHQWRAQPPAQPRPFFYGRVRARLLAEASAERLPRHTWLRWPSYAVLLGILLLLSGDGGGLRSAGPAPPYQVEAQGRPAGQPTR